MDILQQQKQERDQFLQTGKYLRVKELASQLTGKDIRFELTDPSSMTMYGNYNRKIMYSSKGEVIIKVPYDSKTLDLPKDFPYNSKTLDLPEDLLLAFVLSEYFYISKYLYILGDKKKFNKKTFIYSILFIIGTVMQFVMLHESPSYWLDNIVLISATTSRLLFMFIGYGFILGAFIALMLVNKSDFDYELKKFLTADERCVGLTGNSDALINLLNIFKKIEKYDERYSGRWAMDMLATKNNFLQKRIDKLQFKSGIAENKFIR